MNRELSYYLDLNYKIEITKDEAGNFIARLPQFGLMGVTGFGDTVEEALTDLEENKRIVFQDFLDVGEEIPVPESEKDDYSGRFLLRIPKFLHRELAVVAEQNGVSLNQYTSNLLMRGVHTESFESALSAFKIEMQHICHQFWSFLGEPVKEFSREKSKKTVLLEKELADPDQYPKAS